MLRFRLPTLVILLFAPPAAADDAPLSAAEVVVVVDAAQTALVGVGEPPAERALTALVYLAAEGGGDRWDVEAIPRAVGALAAAMGGEPAVRVLSAEPGGPPDTSGLEAALRKAGIPAVVVPGDDALTRQMTADPGGYHPRGEPGRTAPTAAEAIARWRQVASYGHGHAEPMFEPDGNGGQTQLRAPGWDEEVAAYACPFPTLLATPAPAGYAVEMGVAGGRTVSEEALASWCELAARELLRECAGDELTAAFADGDHAEATFGDPPGAGLWWLAPARVLPPGGVGGEPCVSPALDRLRVAADHAGLVLHVGLTEDDVEAGCRRQRLESCRE